MQKITIKGFFIKLNKSNNISDSEILAPWDFSENNFIEFFKQINKNITKNEILANCSENGQITITNKMLQIKAYIEINNNCASKQDILSLFQKEA